MWRKGQATDSYSRRVTRESLWDKLWLDMRLKNLLLCKGKNAAEIKLMKNW